MVLPLLTHSIPKEFPFIFLVFNRFIQYIPNSFQTVSVTLSNTRLVQDVELLKGNISRMRWDVVDYFTRLTTWLLYFFYWSASPAIRAFMHLTIVLSFNHPSAISHYHCPDSLHLIINQQWFFSLIIFFIMCFFLTSCSSAHQSIHPPTITSVIGVMSTSVWATTVHCLRSADPNLI